MFKSISLWRRETIFLLFIVTLCMTAFSWQLPASGSSNAVFEPVPDTDSLINGRSADLGAQVLRSGEVLFNPGLLNSRASSGPLSLTLFEDVVVQADHLRTDSMLSGGQVWVGKEAESPHSEVLISWTGNSMYGHIQRGGALYRIRPVAGAKANSGQHIVEQLTGIFPPGGEPLKPDYAVTPAPSASFNLVTPNTAAETAAASVDVLVVYTSNAKNEAGGSTPIANLIYSAVAQTNSSYQNSNVNVNLNLVHVQEISLSESSNLDTDLSNMRFSTEISDLRDQYGADIVTLIRGDAATYCGKAFIMDVPSDDFEKFAFSVVSQNCATSNLSFAHETGHSFGAQHDRANAFGQEGAYNYSFGYQHTNTRDTFRTIMAYQAGCSLPCPRIPYWSNSNIFYNNQPAGINHLFSNGAANYLTVNNTSPVVASFRNTAPPPTATPTETPTQTNTPTPTNTPTNTPTPTPTNTPTPLPTIVATTQVGQQTSLASGDFRFDFPSGTFTDTVEITILALNPADLPAQPDDDTHLDTTLYQYQVSAVNLTNRTPMDLVIGRDFTITIFYEDFGIRRVKEETLGLFYWDPAEMGWTLAANQNFVQNVRIEADGSSLTYYAVLGEETEKAYLPFISRDTN